MLAWIEPSGQSFNLRYSIRKNNAWSDPVTIAAGRLFWRHPAEVPGMVALPGGSLLAYWVERDAKNTDAEYIYVSSSKDGKSWTTPTMANKDKHPVQHGLASMVASGQNEASLIWLQALKGEDDPASLMRSIIGADGKASKEEELDNDTCTCCPTSAVRTAKGILTAYRDHTSKDIRDIAVMRFEGGKWTASKILYADKWEINACPVNAAAAAAKDHRVAVAWYTEADDKPRVQLSFSSDAGATFTKPVQTSVGDTTGYASVALEEDGGAIVSWLEEGDKDTSVAVRYVSASGVLGPVSKIAQGDRQKLGYPKLVHAGAETWIAWGDPAGPIHTARLTK